MAEPARIIEGTKIVRVKGRGMMVVIQPDTVFRGNPTIQGLAKVFCLQPETVLDSLLGFRQNSHVIRPLYEDYARAADRPETDEVSLWQARRYLRIAATTPTANEYTGRLLTNKAYLYWGLRMPDGGKLLLPYSSAFRKHLKDLRTQQNRKSRIKAVDPAIKSVQLTMAGIRGQASALNDMIKLIKDLTSDAQSACFGLEALDCMLELMQNKPAPDDQPDQSDRTELKTFAKDFAAFKNHAYQSLILDPARFHQTIAHNDEVAKDMIRQLNDAKLLQDVKKLVAHADVVPSDVWIDLCDTLKTVYASLAISSEGETCFQDHILPLIQDLASQPIELPTGVTPTRSDIEKALREAPPPSGKDTIIGVVSGAVGTLPLAIGNMPGPASLSVSMMELFAPFIFRKIVTKAAWEPTIALRLGSWLFRALVKSANLPTTGIKRAMYAAQAGDMKGLPKINWSRSFMNSAAWGSAIAVLSCVVLIFAATGDDKDTVRKWANIISGAAGTGLGVGVALSRLNVAMRSGAIRSGGAFASRLLVVVGSTAAIVSGIQTAREEYGTGDSTGMWLALGGAAGGAISLAGWMIGAGATTASTGVGLAPGAIIMLVGVAIGIIAGVWAAIRDWTRTGTYRVLSAYLTSFSATMPYRLNHSFLTNIDTLGTRIPAHEQQRLKSELQALTAAYEKIKREHHDLDYWDVNPAETCALYDLGFPVNCVALIVNEDEDKVIATLRAEGRKVPDPV